MRRPTAAAALAVLALMTPRSAGALMQLRVGEAPPRFALADLEGRAVDSAALTGAPAVVLFWSTWSPRSAEALEDFKRHVVSYGGRGLKVVAVNIDGESLGAAQKAAVREFAAARALPFPVALDEGLRTFAAWGVMAHPTEVVLDASGRIAYVLPGYPPSLRDELEREIRRVLGVEEPPPPQAPLTVGVAPAGMALQHYNLGRQLLAKGDAEKALAAFKRAAAADASFLDAAVMVARVSLADGSLEEAEQLARHAGLEGINRGDVRYVLGELLLAKGDLAAAEQAFAALRERLPREGWGLWGLGQTALARGERPAALALFREARALGPESPEAEAFVARHFRERWMRRLTQPDDDAFVAVFPALAEVRERYRKLFGAAAAGSAP